MISNKTVGFSVSALALLTAAAPGAFADGPPADQVYFNGAPAYVGNGCPEGTATSTVADDGQSFEVYFDDYVVEVNEGELFQRRYCNLDIDLQYPAGWTYSIAEFTYRGALQLDRGTSARENSTYYFYGAPGSATLTSTWQGPIDDDGLPLPYEFTDEIHQVAWAPCNGSHRRLQIKTDYTVRNNRRKTGHAYASADSIGGQVSTVYYIQWARCPQ